MINTPITNGEAEPKSGTLDFNNTEVAFKSKSDEDLKRGYWLFKMIANNFLVKVGTPVTNFALNIGLPIQGIIRKTIYKHFCGGETIEGCADAIQTLSTQHVGTILDYSIEGEDSESVFDNTYKELLRTVEYAETHRQEVPFSVFKPTGVGRFDLLVKVNAGESLSPAEQTEFDHFKARVDGICKTAYEKKVRLLVDAEHSWIQDILDDIVREMMRKYNQEMAIVYNTYQLYRHDKLASLKADYYLAETDGFHLGAKLVRGAYMEIERERAAEKGYPSPIQPNKEATDRDFNAATQFCLDHLDRISFMCGTHNEQSSLMLAKELDKRKISATDPRVYFAQLLGMSDNLTFNLAASGYNAAKYMPYGPVKSVMPYLFRRAQENTSVAGQTSRELNLLKKEKARRRI